MRSILVVTVLALAACDQDQNNRNDRPTAPGNHPPPPPGSAADAGHPMGRPDMAPDHPPMGHDMGRGDMGRDGNFRVDPSDPNSAMIDELVATVSGDPAHKDIKGTVTFRMQGGSTLVDAKVDGLPKGEHGYHVHVFGDCSDLATKSPGTHLDFHAGMGGMGGAPGTMPSTATAMGTGSGSGAAMPMNTTDMVDATGSHVMGNLGQLTADASGHATGSRTVDARLRQLLGRAVVIHEKANDDSKPDGAAGTPIACGVIGIANPAEKASASTEPPPK
jgi:Cu-Zn family superoxide dismutase